MSTLTGIGPMILARLAGGASTALLTCLSLLAVGAAADGDGLAGQAARFMDVSAILQGYTHTNNGSESVGDNVTGVAWLDCDNDGDLDLYVANGIGADDGLLINESGVFRNKTPAGAGDIGDGNGSSGVAAADLDNDGNTDLIVAGDTAFLKGLPSSRQIRVYRGAGQCTFNEATDADSDGFGAIGAAAGSALSVSLGDINNDGLLDVFVTAPSSLTTEALPPNHLFLNRGNFEFLDVSASAGDAIYALGACNSAFTHYDDDGFIDLLIGDCNLKLDRPAYRDFLAATGIPASAFPPFVTTPLRMMRNNGDGSFSEVNAGLPVPPAPQDQQMPPLENGFWMSSTLGDIDADGDLDVFATNVGEFFSFLEPALGVAPGALAQEHYLGLRRRDGTFDSIERRAGIEPVATKFAWGATFADFDNDGWEDLFFAGNLPELGAQVGDPGYLFINNRNRTFRSVAQPADLSSRYSSGVAVADYDNDGRVDIVIGNGRINQPVTLPDGRFIAAADDRPTLLRNVGATGNNWVAARLVGTTSNRGAVGAQIKLRGKGVTVMREIRAGEGFLSTSSPWPSFGLGRSHAQSVKLLVRWPSGLVEEHRVATRRISTLTEGTGRARKHF